MHLIGAFVDDLVPVHNAELIIDLGFRILDAKPAFLFRSKDQPYHSLESA